MIKIVLIFLLTINLIQPARCEAAKEEDNYRKYENKDTYNEKLGNHDFRNGIYSRNYIRRNKMSLSTDFPQQGTEGSIKCGQTVEGDTRGAVSNYGARSPEHFYAFSLNTTDRVQFDSCNSSFDTIIRIYDADTHDQLAFNDDSSSCAKQSNVTISLLSGNYFVMIEGFGENYGVYKLAMKCQNIGNIGDYNVTMQQNKASTNAPSLLPTNLPSVTPSSTPSEAPSSSCPKVEIEGRTFYVTLSIDGSCLKIEVKEGGFITIDSSVSPGSCSEEEFNGATAVSKFDAFLTDSNKASWTNVPSYPYRGEMLFVESNEVIEPELELVSFTADTFDVVMKLPSCQAPSSAPSMTPSVIPSTQPTFMPSIMPTIVPSIQPTLLPSTVPTSLPSISPSSLPTSTSSPSMEPTNTPSLLPTYLPSATPSSTPSEAPSSSCPKVEIEGRTFYVTLSIDGSCLKIEVKEGGFITIDSSVSPGSCSEEEFNGATVVSKFDVFLTDSNKASWTNVPSYPYKGEMLFVESNEVTEPELEILSFTEKTFDVVMKLPSCTVPSSEPSLTPSIRPSTLPSEYPTLTPSVLPTLTPSLSPSSLPSLMPSIVPTSLPSMTPSIYPSTKASQTPTLNPSFNPSLQPSFVPSTMPTGNPSLQPSMFPSLNPTQQPSVSPSMTPSVIPSSQPTFMPSTMPTIVPSIQPTLLPSIVPTFLPSISPSSLPTESPSISPSMQPSNTPSLLPTGNPSLQPSTFPSLKPTQKPSAGPSMTPSVIPSSQPTFMPSIMPTSVPSIRPTLLPSTVPTSLPSISPSSLPTGSPSISPSMEPSNTPSLLPTYLPSATPSSTPSEAPSLCPKVEIEGLTFYATVDTDWSCWKIEVKKGGFITSDQNFKPGSCSEKGFNGTTVLSKYDSILSVGFRTYWTNVASYPYKGEMLFVESNEVIEPKLEFVSFTKNTFDAVLKFSFCNLPT